MEDSAPINDDPLLLGLANVDLTALSNLLPRERESDASGVADETILDQVYGWYHVVNSAGRSCGQILLGVRPIISRKNMGGSNFTRAQSKETLISELEISHVSSHSISVWLTYIWTNLFLIEVLLNGKLYGAW